MYSYHTNIYFSLGSPTPYAQFTYEPLFLEKEHKLPKQGKHWENVSKNILGDWLRGPQEKSISKSGGVNAVKIN